MAEHQVIWYDDAKITSNNSYLHSLESQPRRGKTKFGRLEWLMIFKMPAFPDGLLGGVAYPGFSNCHGAARRASASPSSR